MWTQRTISQKNHGDEVRIRGEKQSQTLVEAFLVSGLIFMLLPGTFLGV
jgi:hypothetical protein